MSNIEHRIMNAEFTTPQDKWFCVQHSTFSIRYFFSSNRSLLPYPAKQHRHCNKKVWGGAVKKVNFIFAGMYRLDRNAFKIQSFAEADNTTAYWRKQKPEERLKAAWYLICSAYGLDPTNPPRLDRTHFSMRKNG